MSQRALQGVIGVMTIILIHTVINLEFTGPNKHTRIDPLYKSAHEDIGTPMPDALQKNMHDVMAQSKEISSTCDQRTRLRRLIEACPAVTKRLKPAEFKTLKGHLVVNEKLKMIYCYVPKAGCTTWKKLLVNITGYNVSNKLAIHGGNIHKFGMKFLSEYNSIEASKILNDTRYMKFMAVRHPLDRLISAYNDKMVKTYKFGGGYSRRIARHYHPERNASSNATLLEFLQYLSEHYDNIRNEHWLKYTELCQPCTIKYDLILKLETVDDDTQALYDKTSELRPNVKLGILRPPPVLNPSNRNKSSPIKVLKEIANLPEQIMANLYDEYRNDFELFGYSFDKMNHIATCKDVNKECC